MLYFRELHAVKVVILIALIIFVHLPVVAQRPNIIYIMTDDMGYGDLSGYGRKEYKTPHLDRLASQGMKFVNAYSAAPLCTPTRVALMTGRYPARTPVGLIEPLTGENDSAMGLTPEYTSLPTLLKRKGYETALIGKWHLGSQDRHSPIKNGFDYFFGIRSGAADYLSHNSGMRKHDLFENDSLVFPGGYLTDLFSQKATAFIQQKHEQPFFLALCYNAPHWPWQGAADKAYEDTVNFRAGGSPAVFAAMMKSLDEGIGRILKALDDENLTANTLLIFTNDNGGERFSDNGGLTGRKGSLWEGGIRVPAFVRWPGNIQPGQVTQQVAVTMDWTATMLAAAGAEPDKRFPLDGRNLLPVLTGKKRETARTLYWRATQRVQQKAVRMDDWKYLQDEKGEYLFDLSTDQVEKKNLKEYREVKFIQLKKKLAAWEEQMLQPLPLNRQATNN